MRILNHISLLALCAAMLTGCPAQQAEKQSGPALTPMEAPAPRLVDTTQAQRTDTSVITHTGKLVTSMGTITIGFYGLEAPKNVANIVALANRKFYNGIHVHRISKDLLVQLGDPRTKDNTAKAEWGRGGQTADGKVLIDELDSTKPSARVGYLPGVVAMAHRSAKNSGTSQFFICTTNARVLPYQYTILGRVLDGMDVIEKMNAVEVDPGGPFGDTDGPPKDPIVIKGFSITSVKP